VNFEYLAYLAWPILCQRAAEKSDITYGDLGELIGVHHRHIGRVLSVIQDYCLEQKLPPLTILIVNQKTRLPGEGFIAWDADDIPSGLAKVYGDTNWTVLPNPFAYAAEDVTEDDLARRLVERPTKSREVYRLVQDRGVAQSIFRKALLDVYEHSCAFCGLSFDFLLDAAHIVLWSKSSESQRLDVRNGLLLCSVHHRLFDAGVLSVDAVGIIHFKDGEYEMTSEMDELMTSELDGEMIFMPASKSHRPAREALEWREHYARGSES
jgi:putative restriction endonuclease